MSDTPRTDAISHGGSYAGVAGELHKLCKELESALLLAQTDAKYVRAVFADLKVESDERIADLQATLVLRDERTAVLERELADEFQRRAILEMKLNELDRGGDRSSVRHGVGHEEDANG